jgi:Phage capsid family.
MKKQKLNVQAFVNRLGEIQVRMNEITDLCEKENRVRSQAEETEFDSLRRESGIITARIQAANANGGFVEVTNQATEFDTFLRSKIEDGHYQKEEVALKRDAMTTVNSGSAAPLTIGDIVKPLEAGLIYDKVGLPILTGLSGDYCWPVVGNVEASIAGEAVSLSDSKIDIAALKPEPVRLGISIKITNQTINKTAGVALQIVQQQLPLAIARLINKCMFVTSSEDDAYNAKFHGPFADCTNTITFKNALPTYLELLQMKGKVFKEGVENDGTGAYVVDPETYAMLEATPRDAGSGLMIIENGCIGGSPVFQTSHINGIGFGVWGLEPIGQFGDMRFIIDPYTEAKSDITVLTINADWSMNSLRKEAFCLGKFGA